MKKQEAKKLISSYVNKKAKPSEQTLLERFFLDDLKAGTTVPDEQRIIEANERIKSNLLKHIAGQNPMKKISLWPRVAAAAIFLLVSVSLYWFVVKNEPVRNANNTNHAKILPGSNKAVLTLANGKNIVLTDAKAGDLAQQGDVAISKSKSGEILYHKVSGSSASVYNTLTTPRGGMYRLVLSDGTLVILNAASSILYPTVFTGKERCVTVRGEVYFEVKHNAAMPFKVKSSGQTIEVLGTHFNVNAYDEVNHIKTTLLQGAVRVTSGSVSKYLAPGEQSDFSHNEIKVLKVDAEDAIAWKNGLFTFEDESLENIMLNISRWYDVEVSYQDVDRSMPFGGGVSRFEDVSKVLEKLELTGKIHFKIQGRRILVTK
ncbi:FecR family protein [Pedobacter sp. MR22-3]|uniref:FecR family protein n=1 Tax=Pedobacter sp. MR22-3 TaxID=2994552 RepID=UPI0022481C0E|nr:FecR family protein [Pedobacter sp. MR22-3]MCX2584391.1 DUF4974 domain-containing protein [Pedobacter sp. MR22-3]